MAIMLIVLACLLSVPSKEKHEKSLTIAFKEQHAILGKVGMGTFYPKMLTYKNFYVLSVMLENQEIKSVGVASFVLVL